MTEMEQPDPGENVEEDAWDGYQGYTAAEWREWRRQHDDDEDDVSSGEDLPWDELEVENLQVLPDEVLGWLLLRRANLSASSRLSVQASVQNSLSFRDIEMALRDQEEELLQADANRHHSGKRRTFWVEEEGQWGLLAVPDEGPDDLLQEVHWVGNQLPPEVYDPGVDGFSARFAGAWSQMVGMATSRTTWAAGWRRTAWAPFGVERRMIGDRKSVV